MLARRFQLTLVLGALNYPLVAVAIGPPQARLRADARELDPRARDWCETHSMTDITLTDRAARQIGEILHREPSGTMLRLSVEGGGCSGFQYRFDTDRAQEPDDVVVRHNEAALLIDPVSLAYLAGSEVDFVEDLIGASFRVNNPKAKASCGCGTSFAL
jgi:iron-sulfur cluster assembly accessory protein